MKRALPYFLLALGLFSLGLGLLWRIIFKPVDEIPSQPDQAARACVQPAAIQFPAPELALTNLAGDQVRLDGYRGQVVLLNTWATWCPPCRAEMPDLQEYFERHQSEGFTILAVNIGETAELVSEFQEIQGLTFPIWLDPAEETLRALNTVSLPYSIVIDRSGLVQLAWSGATCLATLESEVTPLFQ
jgi:cytochrome c biogenesis protein CcmG/thiol:disulfide interchange protein DsbE